MDYEYFHGMIILVVIRDVATWCIRGTLEFEGMNAEIFSIALLNSEG